MATTAAELMLSLLHEGAVPYLKGDEVALRGGGRSLPPALLAELKEGREAHLPGHRPRLHPLG